MSDVRIPGRLLGTALAVVVGALVAGLLAAPAGAATRSYAVSISGAKDLTYGTSLSIRGRVWPGAVGSYVYLEARSPGSPVFQTRKAIKLRSGGFYAVGFYPDEPGVWQFRIYKPAGDGIRAGRSAALYVRVWRWRPLESLLIAFDEAAGTTPKPSVATGGMTFSPGYVQDPQGARFFRLQRRCSKVDVWAGGDPGSATAETAAARLDGAGVIADPVFDQVIGSVVVGKETEPGHILLGSAIIRPAYYLRLSFSGEVEGNRAVWGRPRVYCMF